MHTLSRYLFLVLIVLRIDAVLRTFGRYEDLKLNVLSHRMLRPLAELLVVLAQTAHAPEYMHHYLRDIGDLERPSDANTIRIAPATHPIMFHMC